MSPDSVHSAQHEQMWALIPWLVNGSLNSEVSAALGTHLEHCAECAHEYAQQQRVHAAMQAEDSIAFASEASFQKLAARLDAAGRVPRAGATLRWLAAAAIVAALGLGAWGGWILRSAPASRSAAYLTLTTPGAPQASTSASQIRVVFTPNLTVSELARLLHSIDAGISAGPTEAGVYTLSFGPEPSSSAEVARRLALLRADTNVRFAEPVASAP